MSVLIRIEFGSGYQIYQLTVPVLFRIVGNFSLEMVINQNHGDLYGRVVIDNIGTFDISAHADSFRYVRPGDEPSSEEDEGEARTRDGSSSERDVSDDDI